MTDRPNADRRPIVLCDQPHLITAIAETRGNTEGAVEWLSFLSGTEIQTRIAVDRGCGRFEWSVLDWNAPAIAAYRRAGAVPLDDWTVYRLTGDALKRLAEEVEP